MANNNNNRNNKITNPLDNLSKKLFSMISGNNKDAKPGKGVKKRKITDKERYSLKGFFIAYKAQFWNLIILNLIYALLLSPIICGLLSVTGVFGTTSPSPSNIFYAPLYGAHLCYPTPATAGLVGVFGAQMTVTSGNAVTTALSIIALIVFLSFGLANAGMTYVLRAYTRGEYAYLWHDFFATIKKNFFGALALGFCDLLIMILLGYSTYVYYIMPGTSNTILFLLMFAMCVIYFMMRFYLYILLITFRLSPIKLVKNALILALLGVKRNFMAVIGILAMLMIYVVILMFSLPFGIIAPFFILVSNGAFIAVFAAYPNVKKYMIDPYYEAHPEKQKDELKIDDEPIFLDRG
ncbi:MAG: DUF624 domain-containing protein [Oscillospiraceae bacterium]|nr:DUF624 domain-containing protein [Oscillospiraceae bacterium]